MRLANFACDTVALTLIPPCGELLLRGEHHRVADRVPAWRDRPGGRALGLKRDGTEEEDREGATSRGHTRGYRRRQPSNGLGPASTPIYPRTCSRYGGATESSTGTYTSSVLPS
jgi:hypothetical protein